MNGKELQRIYIAEGMLKGCLCEMCVTDEKKEFERLYEHAKKYLLIIYDINKSRFENLIKGA